MSALVAPRFGDLRGNKTNSRGTLIEQEIGRHTLLANLKLRWASAQITRICSMQRCTSLQPSGGTNLQRSSQCCRTVPGLSSSIHLVAGNPDDETWYATMGLLWMITKHATSCNRYGRKLFLWDSMILFVGGFLLFTPCICISCRENKTVCRLCRHGWWIETNMCSPKYDMNIDKPKRCSTQQETPVMIPVGSCKTRRPRHSLQNPWRLHWKETSRWRS